MHSRDAKLKLVFIRLTVPQVTLKCGRAAQLVSVDTFTKCDTQILQK